MSYIDLVITILLVFGLFALSYFRHAHIIYELSEL